MRRFQLFELEDFPWFPPVIRDLATDYLHFIEKRFRLHQPVLPLLRRGLEKSGLVSVVDLCSGAGGPVLALYEDLLAEGVAVRFTLTDKYPNLEAFQRLPSGIDCVTESVDGTNVPPELKGFRTMFNAFHHFDPRAGRTVLTCAVNAGQPIGIFEIPERSFTTLIPLLFTPVFVAVATPFIRPFEWRRLLWTYVLPLVPITCWWDGLVSQLRAYTVSELKALAKEAGDYDWEAGRIPIGVTPGHITYLLGFPIELEHPLR
ncbi:MAG: hypothetical protein M3O35_00365 [Acidobacteriota bacterium]|nr:hypothetical protein [Acidobacteriota bacterium]